MGAEDEVVAIMVVLLVDDRQALFALLDSQGSINRMGSGLIDGGLDLLDRDMFVGVVNEDLFQQLRGKISPAVNAFLGHQLNEANPMGKLCELKVAVKYANGRDAASVWRYGSESEKPHPGIVTFVQETIQITEPWFQEQKAMVTRASQAE